MEQKINYIRSVIQNGLRGRFSAVAMAAFVGVMVPQGKVMAEQGEKEEDSEVPIAVSPVFEMTLHDWCAEMWERYHDEGDGAEEAQEEEADQTEEQKVVVREEIPESIVMCNF